MNDYETRSLPLSVFLRFCMGDEPHIATTRGPYGCSFTFTDAERCRDLQKLFFGEEPVAIGDVRELLEVDKAIRWTIRYCDQIGNGLWKIGDQ